MRDEGGDGQGGSCDTLCDDEQLRVPTVAGQGGSCDTLSDDEQLRVPTVAKLRQPSKILRVSSLCEGWQLVGVGGQVGQCHGVCGCEGQG